MICEKNKCTGCFACYNICPQNAIEMVEDEYGFIYPQIDKALCTDCNLCKKICPSNQEINLNECIECYAAKSKNLDIYKKSSSGGICTELSKYFTEKNGIVYGAALDSNGVFKHIRVSKIEDIKKIQGSKYVQSYTMESYKLAKDDLENNKLVLYIGTPCQIIGLKKFLIKDYKNLYTIDLICHGVPSQKFLREEISRYIDIKNLKHISFRGEKNFSLVLNNKIEIPSYESYYYYGFLKTYIYRESCYSCKYATHKRVADMTLGDFWGLKTDVEFEHENGINCVIINNNKGKEMFEFIKKILDYYKVKYQEAIDGNAQLKFPSKRTQAKEKFIRYYLKYGFIKSCKKTFGLKFAINMIIKKLKNILKKNKIIKEMYKRIKR